MLLLPQRINWRADACEPPARASSSHDPAYYQIFLIWTALPVLPSCPRQLTTSEDAMAKFLLVSFKTCPWVQRAAIVLREKKVEFEFQHIEPDNRPDWFLAISPHKKVPVLRIDDRVSLFESNAIAEYLDETVA